jgi:hypothetical protein
MRSQEELPHTTFSGKEFLAGIHPRPAAFDRQWFPACTLHHPCNRLVYVFHIGWLQPRFAATGNCR